METAKFVTSHGPKFAATREWCSSQRFYLKIKINLDDDETELCSVSTATTMEVEMVAAATVNRLLCLSN